MNHTTNAFTIRYVAETISGERGFSYTISDVSGRFCGGGWSRGAKREAEADARAQVERLQAPSTQPEA